MSSGRDRRWSPSLTSVSTTSSRAKPRHQFDRVPPRHVGVLHALQDAHRASGLDQPAEQEMLAPLLDQPAGDRIGAFRILRRPQPGRRSSRSARFTSAENFFHISSSVKSTAGAISTMPATAARPPCVSSAPAPAAAPASRPSTSRPAPAGPRRSASKTASTFLKPAADRAVSEVAARFAVPGIVEADAGAARSRRPIGRAPDGLGALHVGLEAAEPKDARALAFAQPHGNGARRRRRFDGQRDEARFAHGWDRWILILSAASRPWAQDLMPAISPQMRCRG